jgi:L-threonylcarbamoyladenylate synthase
MVYLYPTDTVFGLGVDATDERAVRELKELKGRPEGKPISIIVSSLEMLEEYAEISPLARKLIERYWPGKLTLVLKVKRGVVLPYAITGDTDTVGVRMPDNEIALGLVRKIGKPLTTTSANVAGEPTLSTVPEILAQFGEKVTHIVHEEGWPKTLPESLPSTVIDATGGELLVLREGAIPVSELKEYLT